MSKPQVLARLAALVPRPRSHLIRFHGLFAPNARHRRLVVPGPAPAPVSEGAEQGATRTHAQMSVKLSVCAGCSTSMSAAARAVALRFACLCVLYRDVRMSREAGCRKRHHRPAGDRSHPRPPRDPRSTRPTAGTTLNTSPGRFSQRCAWSAARGPAARASWSSAWMPRRCQ